MGHQTKIIANTTLDGQWYVAGATQQREGLQNIQGATLEEFNDHLADFLPEGEKVVVYDETHKPIPVLGRHRAFE